MCSFGFEYNQHGLHHTILASQMLYPVEQTLVLSADSIASTALRVFTATDVFPSVPTFLLRVLYTTLPSLHGIVQHMPFAYTDFGSV